MNGFNIACLVLLAVFPPSWGRGIDEALDVCEEVAREGEAQGVPPALVVAMAYRESGLRRDEVSKTGAVGPLQVHRKFWCEGGVADPDCDNTEAGVKAIAHFIKRRPTLDDEAHFYSRPVASFTGASVTGNDEHVENILALYDWLSASMRCRCSLVSPAPPTRREP